jgi:hypothetical protein
MPQRGRKSIKVEPQKGTKSTKINSELQKDW